LRCTFGCQRERQAQTQTIEQQVHLLREYSQKQGWLWNEEHIFRDDGYSGAGLRRPGLDRLRDQVRNAAFDRVLVTAPDRLARNYVHQMLLMEEFERCGCQIEFLDQPTSRNPHDQLLVQIRGAVAEYERSLIAERMRRGRQQKYRAGLLVPWTRPPYGYRVDPARPRDPAGVRVEPAEAAVVAELFHRYQQGQQSLVGLTKELMRQQIPTPRGKRRWNQATVRGILCNPVYTGTVFIGRYRVARARHRQSALRPVGHEHGGHPASPPQEWEAVAQVPAIITQDQIDLVQAKLAQNQQYARRNNTAHPYLLRALVSCGSCHLSCTGRYRKTKVAEYAYYTCRGKGHPVVSCRDERCRSRFIPAGQLDELVWKDLCEVLTHPQMIAEALQRAQGGQWLPQELQARRENLRKARVSLTQQTERLTDAYLAAVLPLEEYQRRRLELEQRQIGIAEQARQLEVSVGRHDELAGVVQSIEAFCQRVQQGLASASFEQKRHLIELLIDRVIVTNEEVEIRYVIPTSASSEHVRFCHLRLDYFNFPPLPYRLDHLGKRGALRGKHEVICFLLRIVKTATDEQKVSSIVLPLMQDRHDRPIKQSRSFGAFAHTEPLPIVGVKHKGFGLSHRHPFATIGSLYPHRLITCHRQDVGVLMRFQPGAQIQVPPIHAIGDHPGERDLCFPEAFNHLLGQFTFGLKTNRLGNTSLSAPLRIVDPVLGKIEFAVDEGMSFCAHVAEKDAHLTVLHLSGRPAILFFHPC
jgi:site-specific DNA recombinase